MQSASKSNGPIFRTHLAVTEFLILEGGDSHVHRLDDPQHSVVGFFGFLLQFQNRPVKLVDDQDRLHPLREGLLQHGARLHANPVYAGDHHKGAISQPQSGRHLKITKIGFESRKEFVEGESFFTFRREVDVTRGINHVEQEFVAISVRGYVFGVHFEMKRQAGRLDGDTTFNLIRPNSISEPFLSGDPCNEEYF